MIQNAFNPTQFNPFTLWTDLAMKATDSLVSSGQAISERVDRVTRASANVDPQEVEPSRLMSAGTAIAVTEPSVDMMLRLQSTSLELFARIWQQWFASLGAVSALAPRPLLETMTQELPRLAEGVTDVEPKRRRSAASAKRQTRAKTSSRATTRRSKEK